VRKPRTKEASLALPPDGHLRVAIVADTHAAPHPRAAALLAELKPHAILHAGDIGASEVIEDLAKIAPTHAVRGNIDDHAFPDDLVLDVGPTRLLLTHIAVAGPKLRADAAQRAREVDASLVVCGHSHVPFWGRDRGLVIFNPGSMGPRRFQLPIVFGLMELKEGRWSFGHVDCETGAAWHP